MQLLTLPIFTYELSTSDYGILALTQAYGTFVIAVTNLGIPLSYQRNFFKYESDVKSSGQLLSVCQIFLIGVSLVSLLLTFLFEEAIAGLLLKTQAYPHVLVYGLMSMALKTNNQVYCNYLINKKNASAYSQFLILESVLALGLSLLLVLGCQQGLVGLLLAQIISSLMVLALMTMYIYRQVSPGWNYQLLKEAIHIGHPLSLRSFLGVLNSQFDKYMIGLLESMSQVGIYNIAHRIASVVFILMTSLGNIFTPHLYNTMFAHENNKQEGGRQLGPYLTPFAYASLFLALGIGAFAEEIVYLFAAPEFKEAGPIIMVLCLYFSLLFFGKVNGTQIIWAKRSQVLMLTSLLGLVLNIVVNVPLIKRYGGLGAGLGGLCSQLLLGYWQHKRYGQRYFRIYLESLKLIEMYGLVFLGMVLLLLLEEMGWGYEWRLILKLSLMLVYVCLGWKRGYVRWERWQELRGKLTA